MTEIEERFWSQVDKSGDCWMWTGKTTVDDYGCFHATINGQRAYKAHRASWMLRIGKVPRGRLVCHSCDEPLCVNPDHLWLGTHEQNQLDMQRKGRQVRGEQHGCAKLTEQQVIDIKTSDLTIKELSEQYGMHNSHIGRILNGEKWAHVKVPTVDAGRRDVKTPKGTRLCNCADPENCVEAMPNRVCKLGLGLNEGS